MTFPLHYPYTPIPTALKMARSKQAASRAMRKLLRDRRKANRGDLKAEQRLRSTVEQWTERANKMLDTLEKHGYTKQAYKSALGFIHAAYGEEENRFATNLTSTKAMYTQAMTLNHFFTLESSTLKGSRAIENRRIKAFREHFLADPDNKWSGAVKKMKRKDILDFFDFLHDTPIGEYLADKSKYESGDDMDSFMNAIYGLGLEKDEITKAFAMYVNTENNIQMGTIGELKPKERFYHDDLINYLKGKYTLTFDGSEVTIHNNEKA